MSARTHQLTLEQKVSVLREHRIGAVVNLWHTIDLDVQQLCPEYLHCSMSDGKCVDLSLLNVAVDYVVDHLDNQQSVLVHCYGGRNRAGLVVAASLIRYLHMTGVDAVHHVQNARAGSLVNRSFVTFLMGVSVNDLQSAGNIGIWKEYCNKVLDVTESICGSNRDSGQQQRTPCLFPET